jgi:hypothetical protein
MIISKEVFVETRRVSRFERGVGFHVISTQAGFHDNENATILLPYPSGLYTDYLIALGCYQLMSRQSD